MFKYINMNPDGNRVDDCVIRAIALAADKDWDDVYDELAVVGFNLKAMPSTNFVWDTYLRSELGFKRYIIPDTCPFCYTVRQFTTEHPYGSYILATGSHVVAVIDGDYYDTWDSGKEVPIYYYERRPL